MAIAMAQAGGLGVIHKNLDPATQADHVRQVKRFESGMVVNPITISPKRHHRRILAIKQAAKISGIPLLTTRASWSASSPTATSASPPT